MTIHPAHNPPLVVRRLPTPYEREQVQRVNWARVILALTGAGLVLALMGG